MLLKTLRTRSSMEVIFGAAQPALSRVKPPVRNPLRVGVVQTHWNQDPAEHKSALTEGIRLAAENGARMVFLPELTLSRYPADSVPLGIPNSAAEPLDGATFKLAAQAAVANKVFVQASLYENAQLSDGRGFNTAILVGPDGKLVGRTRKTHIPVTAGYYEDLYFAPGPHQGEGDPYATYRLDLPDVGCVHMGMPTCWDQWFPEVARNYSLRGAEMLVYPTAIGSDGCIAKHVITVTSTEPDHPDFDTEPLWRQVIVGNAISNGTFMLVPNRWGNEGTLSFYGSSFICDPYGRILARAPRHGDALLIADLDLDQRRDWFDLFPMLATRRPETYGALLEPVKNKRTGSGEVEPVLESVLEPPERSTEAGEPAIARVTFS